MLCFSFWEDYWHWCVYCLQHYWDVPRDVCTCLLLGFSSEKRRYACFLTKRKTKSSIRNSTADLTISSAICASDLPNGKSLQDLRRQLLQWLNSLKPIWEGEYIAVCYQRWNSALTFNINLLSMLVKLGHSQQSCRSLQSMKIKCYNRHVTNKEVS